METEQVLVRETCAVYRFLNMLNDLGGKYLWKNAFVMQEESFQERFLINLYYFSVVSESLPLREQYV